MTDQESKTKKKEKEEKNRWWILLLLFLLLLLLFVLKICHSTRNAPCDHVWEEATCVKGKTCSKCGEQSGVPLGHQWLEANYAAPKTCSRCGATEGTSLTPYFEEHGLSCDWEPNTEVPYQTVVAGSTTEFTEGKCWLGEVAKENEWNGQTAQDGYEWCILTFATEFSNPSAEISFNLVDYYRGELKDHQLLDKTGILWENYLFDIETLPMETATKARFRIAIQKPVGYDGVVLCIYSGRLKTISPYTHEKIIGNVKENECHMFRVP